MGGVQTSSMWKDNPKAGDLRDDMEKGMTPEQLNEVVDYLLSLAGTASTPSVQTPTTAPVDSKDFE